MLTAPSYAADSAEDDYPNLFPTRQLTVRTTAYHHEEADHLVFGKKNALGGELRATGLRSAAANWAHFPVGTEFVMIRTGERFVVEDYGIALTGKATIDIYVPEKKAIQEWGVRHEIIRITKVGDWTESLRILEKTKQYDFIKEMARQVRERLKLEEERLARLRYRSSQAETAYQRNRPAPLPADAFTRNKPGPIRR